MPLDGAGVPGQGEPSLDRCSRTREVLLTHFAYPAEHWLHLHTTNAIESTFATVRLRTNKTKGAGSRSAGLAMAYKLLEAAQARWRCVNRAHLVALVRAGATFVDGVNSYPPRAPYDRIIATCSVARIPAAWSQQVRPGGVLVAPLASGLLVGLHRHLVGRADAMTVGFMPLRSDTLPDEDAWAPFAQTADVRDVAAPEEWLLSGRVRFHARLLVPDLEITFKDGDWGLASRFDGSWSRLRRMEDGERWLAQGGPRRL